MTLSPVRERHFISTAPFISVLSNYPLNILYDAKLVYYRVFMVRKLNSKVYFGILMVFYQYGHIQAQKSGI